MRRSNCSSISSTRNGVTSSQFVKFDENSLKNYIDFVVERDSDLECFCRIAMDMKSKLFSAAVLLTVCLTVACPQAAALEIRFSGTITEAIEGNYGVAVGDRFSGYLFYDPILFADAGGLGVAIIEIQTATGSPDIEFYYPNSSLMATEGAFFLVGNPYDFFGSIYLLMDGVTPIGGDVSMSSEPGKNNGSFRGVIDVPDTASSIVLFILGLAAIMYWRRITKPA